jgi:hypothetical protein
LPKPYAQGRGRGKGGLTLFALLFSPMALLLAIGIPVLFVLVVGLLLLVIRGGITRRPQSPA